MTFLFCFLMILLISYIFLIYIYTYWWLNNTQTFSPTADLAIPTRTPFNETNAKIETHSLIVETEIGKCLK